MAGAPPEAGPELAADELDELPARPSMPEWPAHFDGGRGARRTRRRTDLICCGQFVNRDSSLYRIVVLWQLLAILAGAMYVVASPHTAGPVRVWAIFAPVLICAPFFIAAICKAYYDRKIEAALQGVLLEAGMVSEEDTAKLERLGGRAQPGAEEVVDGEIIAEIVDANGRSVFGDEDDKLPSAGFWPGPSEGLHVSAGAATEGRGEERRGAAAEGARSSSDDES